MADTGETPYARFPKRELILRDYLAAHRTTLANDRTLLAYIRTTLTFLIGGASFVQFFSSAFIRGLGWAFLPVAALTLLLGLFRYQSMRHSLAQIGAGSEEGGPPSAD